MDREFPRSVQGQLEGEKPEILALLPPLPTCRLPQVHRHPDQQVWVQLWMQNCSQIGAVLHQYAKKFGT